jgi:hypothetical protein
LKTQDYVWYSKRDRVKGFLTTDFFHQTSLIGPFFMPPIFSNFDSYLAEIFENICWFSAGLAFIVDQKIFAVIAQGHDPGLFELETKFENILGQNQRIKVCLRGKTEGKQIS